MGNNNERQKHRGFYSYRGSCYGHGLDDLWKKIEEVDEAEREASRHLDRYLFDSTAELGPSFMRVLGEKVQRYRDGMDSYLVLFSSKCNEGKIVFQRKSDGEEVSLKEAVKLGPLEVIRRCVVCRTEIPYLKYEGWNE